MNRQLDILFIHPNASKKIYQDLSNDYSAIEPPIWAAMLAQHCRSNGFGSQILDCEAERLNYIEAAQVIKDVNPRIACFVVYGQQPSASTQNMHGAVGLADELKKIAEECNISLKDNKGKNKTKAVLYDSINLYKLNK